jgi:hypothetical protein
MDWATLWAIFFPPTHLVTLAASHSAATENHRWAVFI